ncbi:hypothetical protein FO440_11960 [Mucilaginibacter corticis]|uniref:Uncharacterized protein n=1 Tax=Mucilaginibacter corticis TaxID=2597670 RepID=A0A556MKM6_9SPHI|nr:hypothetical protein [Mucilaginibacter corticis]TSJ40464.1 hypothetical protein FO440_11960 [Mucilaginibacter corticis]
MKKALMLCLLAFGINVATKAQCPINEILTTKDPQTIATLIENNTECIKESLTQNPEFQNFRVYVDYLYNTSRPWIYHTNLQKEKLFADFYATWGLAYPTMSSPAPADPEFYEALKAMVATDPAFFTQRKETKIPVKYQQWLYVKSLIAKYGERNVVALANAAGKVANLATNNYQIYVAN